MSYVKPHMRNGKPVKGYSRGGGGTSKSASRSRLALGRPNRGDTMSQLRAKIAKNSGGPKRSLVNKLARKEAADVYAKGSKLSFSARRQLISNAQDTVVGRKYSKYKKKGMAPRAALKKAMSERLFTNIDGVGRHMKGRK